MVPEKAKKVGLPCKMQAGRPWNYLKYDSMIPIYGSLYTLQNSYIVIRTFKPTLSSIFVFVVHMSAALHFYFAVRITVHFRGIRRVNMGTGAFGSRHLRVGGAEIGGL